MNNKKILINYSVYSNKAIIINLLAIITLVDRFEYHERLT